MTKRNLRTAIAMPTVICLALAMLALSACSSGGGEPTTPLNEDQEKDIVALDAALRQIESAARYAPETIRWNRLTKEEQEAKPHLKPAVEGGNPYSVSFSAENMTGACSFESVNFMNDSDRVKPDGEYEESSLTVSGDECPVAYKNLERFPLAFRDQKNATIEGAIFLRTAEFTAAPSALPKSEATEGFVVKSFTLKSQVNTKRAAIIKADASHFEMRATMDHIAQGQVIIRDLGTVRIRGEGHAKDVTIRSTFKTGESTVEGQVMGHYFIEFPEFTAHVTQGIEPQSDGRAIMASRINGRLVAAGEYRTLRKFLGM